jgi:cyclopropane fatty-acyl-phospholipid synthase-like methyltransferase
MTRVLSLLLSLSIFMQAKPGPAPAPDEHGRDRYQNPHDLNAYIAAQVEPARDAWQKPDKVLQALHVRAGQIVCDIGAGPGYFSLRLARLVGPAGRVYAVDVDPQILNALRDRIEKGGFKNVTPVLGTGGDPLLPERSCDLILIVDTYHHFSDRPAYLRQLVRLLKAEGRVANVDFHKRATPIGPPLEHRVAREEFLHDAAAAGLAVVEEPTFLENQYFVVLKRRANGPASVR